MDSIVKGAIKRAKSMPSKAKRKIKPTQDNEELIRLLETARAKIRVVGVGGGGCNTIERMTEIKERLLRERGVLVREALEVINQRKLTGARQIRPPSV